MWRGMSESTWVNERDVERAGVGASGFNNDEEASLVRADEAVGLRVAHMSRRRLAPAAILLPCLLAGALLAWRGSSKAAAGDLRQADVQSLEGKQLLETLEGATFAGAEVVKAYGEWRTKHNHMIHELDGLYNASLYKPREVKIGEKEKKAILAFPLGSMEDINGTESCMHDEEQYAGVCYKKCSLLTAGAKPIRTSAFACCEEEPCSWFNTKWSFGVCSGFSVRGDSMGKGCGHVPGKCLSTEELLGGQCYQKCSFLTNGSYPFRQSPTICCKAMSKFACLDPMVYKAGEKYAVGGRLGNKLIPEKLEEPHPPLHELTQVRNGGKTWVQQLLASSTEEQRALAEEAKKVLKETHNVKKKIMAKKEELKEKMMLPPPATGLGGGLQAIESSDGKLPKEDDKGTEEKSEEAAKELEEMMAGVVEEEKEELTALRSIVKEGSGAPSATGAQPLAGGKEPKNGTGLPANASSSSHESASALEEAAPSDGTAPTPGEAAAPESLAQEVVDGNATGQKNTAPGPPAGTTAVPSSTTVFE